MLFATMLSFTLLFAVTAAAEEFAPVYVGGVEMNDGDYLANDADAVSDAKPSVGYAYYKDGVLTLDGYSYNGKGYQFGDAAVDTAVIYADSDLVIEVKNDNEIMNSQYAAEGIRAVGDITIDGEGFLDVGAYAACISADEGKISISNIDLKIESVVSALRTTGGAVFKDSKLYAESAMYPAIFVENELVFDGGEYEVYTEFVSAVAVVDGDVYIYGAKIDFGTPAEDWAGLEVSEGDIYLGCDMEEAIIYEYDDIVKLLVNDEEVWNSLVLEPIEGEAEHIDEDRDEACDKCRAYVELKASAEIVESAGGNAYLAYDNYKAGQTATIIVKPDTGKAVDEIIIRDSKGNIIPVEMNEVGNYTFVQPADEVQIEIVYKKAAPTIFLPVFMRYNVTYHANNGDRNDIKLAGGYTLNTVIAAAENEFTNNGKTFNGWNTEADGSGTTYISGAKITVNKHIHLYAMWK